MVTLHYFPLRGRAEVVKLICSAKNIPYEVVDVDFQNMKTDRVAYPFGQCPRMVDGDVDISQSNAMIRHLARKHQLYGSGDKEMAHVDMLIDGVESIRGKYLILIYQDQLNPEAKDTYWATHGAKDSANGRNGGAHFDYLEALLAANGGGSAFFVGAGLTAADLCVWQIVDLHMRLFKEQMEATYPLLAGHYKRIADLPGVKEYLASPQRLEKVNGNGLG